ncbi:MAG: putative secreted protein [Parachlamydiales bacterium]|nr:putative secreted protein [Parachlamydiales bacterium]
MPMPQPYASIRPMPEYAFAYYGNANQIEELFNKNDIHTVIEIGSWIGGGSTRHIGSLLKQRPGTLYAIDTWLGSSTQQPGQEHYQPILKEVYHQFLSNMIHWDLTDVVIPCRMRSLEAIKALNIQPDLIYIDGEHTFDAVMCDMNAWYPLVKKRGILCGDDWTWTSVQDAVISFAESQQLKVIGSDNFWRLQ